MPEKLAFPCIYYKSRIWSSQDARVHILVLFTLWYQDSALRVSKLITNFHSLFLPIFFRFFFSTFLTMKKSVCVRSERIFRGNLSWEFRLTQSDFTTFFSASTFFKKFLVKFSPLLSHFLVTFAKSAAKLVEKSIFLDVENLTISLAAGQNEQNEPKSFLGCPKWFE